MGLNAHARKQEEPSQAQLRTKGAVSFSPDHGCTAGHQLWVVMVIPDGRETANVAMPAGGLSEKLLLGVHRHRMTLERGFKQRVVETEGPDREAITGSQEVKGLA